MSWMLWPFLPIIFAAVHSSTCCHNIINSSCSHFQHLSISLRRFYTFSSKKLTTILVIILKWWWNPHHSHPLHLPTDPVAFVKFSRKKFFTCIRLSPPRWCQPGQTPPALPWWSHWGQGKYCNQKFIFFGWTGGCRFLPSHLLPLLSRPFLPSLLSFPNPKWPLKSR